MILNILVLGDLSFNTGLAHAISQPISQYDTALILSLKANYVIPRKKNLNDQLVQQKSNCNLNFLFFFLEQIFRFLVFAFDIILGD